MNRWLDAIPRQVVWATGRPVPAFRAFAAVGAHAGLVVGLAAALLRGLPATTACALAGVTLGSAWAWARGRRAITGTERLVLLEHVWVAGFAVAGGAAATGTPVLPWLDVLAVAVAACAAVGRIGCLAAGCCHGRPHAVGVGYGRDRTPHPLAGVRLFPLPLVESAGLLVIAGTGLAASPFASPGAVTVWALASYGVLRSGTEVLRGDHRPVVAGLAVPRLAAGLQIAAAAVVDQVRRDTLGSPGGAAAVAALMVAAAVVARRGRHEAPPVVALPSELTGRTTTAPSPELPDVGGPVHRPAPDRAGYFDPVTTGPR